MSNGTGYTTHISYEIKDSNGNVMDSLTEDILWPQTREQASAHKYLLMNHIYSIRSGDAAPALVGIVKAVDDM